MCFEEVNVKMNAGMAIIVAIAEIALQSTPVVLIKSVIATGNVRLIRSVMTKASGNSFQHVLKVKIATTTSPGLINGAIIEEKILR